MRNEMIELKRGEYVKMLKKDMVKNKYIYIMASIGLAYYIIFHYVPMYGMLIAFKNYSPTKGVLGSQWIGFLHFKDFLSSYNFRRLLKNTLLINIYSLLWGFPAPIILALLINELKNISFKRIVQTITYLPHFISTVVICGMIVDFTSSNGLFNNIIFLLGGVRTNLLMESQLFRTIFISSGIWQGVGWGSIIYLASLTSINPELYEAAIIDGANRWKQVLHITLPGIMPTIIIMLILRMGSMMNVDFQKIILLYNPATYETSDVISSYVYRQGILGANYSYSTAVGLFNSVINFFMIVTANMISRKVNETSLW